MLALSTRTHDEGARCMSAIFYIIGLIVVILAVINLIG